MKRGPAVSELRQRSARTPANDGVVRHGKLKRGAAWKALLSIVAGSLAVVLVSGVAVASIAVWQLQSNIDTVSIEADELDGPPPSIGAYQGGFNILIVGSDTREGQGSFGADSGSELNDVNMLLHVSEDQKSAVLVSIPRDMVVPLPACKNGGPATGLPINETLYYGGLSCTVDTVQNLTGLKIHFAGIITFRGVISMSNAIGGVDVCISEAIHDPYVHLHLKAGTRTLKGATALKFLRSRHGVGDGSDLGRISSQQVFLSSLVRKIKSDDTLTDFGKLYGIAQAATQNMTLSKNFARPDTLVSIALALKNIPLKNIAMVQYPSRTGGVGIYSGKVQPIETTATLLFNAIKKDVPIGLDANAVGANGGSELDPNAPKPTPKPSSSPDPSATPEDPGPKAQLIPGLKGQTAAQHTCSVAN
jgi:LCP family protein required for cell wall assembly